MTARRAWWVTGAVVVAGVLFGLGVVLGAVVFGDDDSSDEVSERVGGDDREPGELFDDLLDRLDDRLEQRLDRRFEGPDGEDDAAGPRRFGPFGDLGERLRDRLDLEGLDVPEDLDELGRCLGEGAEDLFDGNGRPFTERARELWERCTP